MKKFILFIALSIVIGIGFLISRRESMPQQDQIEYRGEIIRLTKAYSDYDDYKDDSVNILPTEAPRVEQLVLTAPIANEFPGRWELIMGVNNLQFPGFGLRQFGEKPQLDGSVLSAWSIEVPLANKSRVLTFRGKDGRYQLLDDFVDSPDQNIASVVENSGQLIYSSMDGKQVVTRPIVSK